MQKGLLISWLGLIAMTLAIGNAFISSLPFASARVTG